MIGSGIDADNIAAFGARADGLIVGSWLKRDGFWRNPVDEQRVRVLSDALSKLR